MVFLSGCCFPVSPLCSVTLLAGAVFSCPICSLICSQLLQFAFAEDPQIVVAMKLLCGFCVRRGWALPLVCSTFPSPAVALLRSSCCLPCLHRGSRTFCVPHGFVPLWWLFLPPSAECSALFWVAALGILPGNAGSRWMCHATNNPFWPAFHATASVSGVGWGFQLLLALPALCDGGITMPSSAVVAGGEGDDGCGHLLLSLFMSSDSAQCSFLPRMCLGWGLTVCNMLPAC